MENDLSMNTVVVDSDSVHLSNIIRMLNNTLHIENEEKQPHDNEEKQPHDNEEETMEPNLQDIINYRRHSAMLMNTMFNNISTLLNPNRNVSSIDDDSSILNDSFQQDNSLYKNVISEQGNVELKTIIFSKEKFEYDTCPILHTQFEEGEEITQLPCNHVFDTTAINKWLQNEKAECPICRYKMSSKELKIEQAQAQGATGAHAHVTATGQIYTDTRGRFSGYNRQPQQIENNSSEDIELQQAILNSIQQTRDV